MMIWQCMLMTISCGLIKSQRIVDTEYGQVRGHVVNVNNGLEQTTVDVFHGIPFAKDTSGVRRFAMPEPPEPWTGILEADTIGNMCPQDPSNMEISNPGWNKFGEDCLHLSIYTPTSTGPFPVMFWIYGGGYQVGGNAQYPGHFLASRGVVVVTVNYRLGKFGFQYTANDACSGNAGLWDQNLGLQFVVNNIGNFGGDPSRITVFGQSAGSGSASLHLLSPHSKDLFQQAIFQSGSETGYWVINPPASQPEDYSHQVAQDLGCFGLDDYDMMDCMRQLPWEDILYNSSITCTPGFSCGGMVPVVDGVGGFLPEMPVDLRKSGNVMSGPIISGITEEDGSILVPALHGNAEICCNRTVFSASIRYFVDVFSPRLLNRTEDNCYHALDYNYTPWPHIDDAHLNRNMLVQLYTDWVFGMPWDKQLKDHQMVAPTYGYVYDYQSINSTMPDWFRTSHSAELNYVWGYTMMDFNEEVRNDSLFGYDGIYNDFDVQYTIYMQELWTNFAKYGNPTPTPVINPIGGSSVWPQFTQESMDLMYLGANSMDTITEYRQKNYAFWSEYLLWVTGEELDPSAIY